MALLWGSAWLVACSGVEASDEEAGWGQSEGPIDLSTCPDSIKCPTVPSRDDCKGKWWDSASTPGTPNPECPSSPPSSTCDTVVLGRCNDTYSDICKYRNCPGYIALNMKDWSIEKNDKFIACAQAGLLDKQCKDITIGSPSDHVPDPAPGETGSVTYRELCQLKACGCPPKFKGDGGTASGCNDAGTDAGPVDAGTSDAGTADAGTADAGRADAGTADAGIVDAGTHDGGEADAGTSDAGFVP
ncbi:hypothetical protein ACN469_30720 [Corallococcus terminator]